MKVKNLVLPTVLVATLSLSLSATQKEGNCVKVGEFQVGNRSQTAHAEVVRSEVLAQAKNTDADKIVLNLVRHEHGKLGTRYYAKAHALKCN